MLVNKHFAEYWEMHNYVKEHHIKDWYYSFTFAYGYTLKYDDIQFVESILHRAYDSQQVTLTEDETIAIENLYDNYKALTTKWDPQGSFLLPVENHKNFL